MYGNWEPNIFHQACFSAQARLCSSYWVGLASIYCPAVYTAAWCPYCVCVFVLSVIAWLFACMNMCFCRDSFCVYVLSFACLIACVRACFFFFGVCVWVFVVVFARVCVCGCLFCLFCFVSFVFCCLFVCLFVCLFKLFVCTFACLPAFVHVYFFPLFRYAIIWFLYLCVKKSCLFFLSFLLSFFRFFIPAFLLSFLLFPSFFLYLFFLLIIFVLSFVAFVRIFCSFILCVVSLVFDSLSLFPKSISDAWVLL